VQLVIAPVILTLPVGISASHGFELLAKPEKRVGRDGRASFAVGPNPCAGSPKDERLREAACTGAGFLVNRV
jgi:hypothetical protein